MTRFYSILFYFRWVSIEQTNYTNERTVINIFPSKIKSHLSLPTLKNWPSNEQPEECSISGAPNLYLLCLPESSVINIAPPPPTTPIRKFWKNIPFIVLYRVYKYENQAKLLPSSKRLSKLVIFLQLLQFNFYRIIQNLSSPSWEPLFNSNPIDGKNSNAKNSTFIAMQLTKKNPLTK